MAKNKVTEVVAKFVEMLESFTPEERKRVISATLTLLGDEAADTKNLNDRRSGKEEDAGLNNRARSWRDQNGITSEQLQQVFHFADGNVEVIASEVPGSSNKERTHSAYVLTGIAALLAKGSPGFDDKSARSLCESLGCYDRPNHAKYVGSKSNELTGSKEKGWTLTAPGLKRGAEIVKELSRPEK